MLQYNAFVAEAFAEPEFVLNDEVKQQNLITATAGERPSGVWFSLHFDSGRHQLYYKVYGSPYAIAAAEHLAREVAAKRLSPGTELNLEEFRQILDMPFPYMNILLTLEDAWTSLVA